MKTIKLFFLMLLYKLSLDIGFWKILVLKSNYFSLDFSIYKYILGFVWCIILFFAIDHLSRRCVRFFALFNTIIANCANYNSFFVKK